MESSTAVAFPGLPLIFAEGYQKGRVSMHGHISLALTSPDSAVRTETVVEKSDRNVFLVDGSPLDDSRGRDMLKLRDLMMEKSGLEIKSKISSRNHRIMSGSSDSGAAALTLALNDFFRLELSLDELHAVARVGSETAYRSLYGGLCEYFLRDGRPSARELLHFKSWELRDVVIYAVPFSYPRYSADVLQSNIVQHPNYGKRLADVENRLHEFKSFLVERDFRNCWRLMEKDSSQVHGMFEDLGLVVRKPGMLELCRMVEQWREDDLECYWNVAGASVVYVFTSRKDRQRLKQKLAGRELVEYKVGGPAELV